MGQMNTNHFDDCKKRTGGAYQRTKSYESESNHRQDGQHHQEFLPFARQYKFEHHCEYTL